MTVKEAKEFFRSIRAEHTEIRHLKDLLQETESGLLPQAIRYDKTKVHSCLPHVIGWQRSICREA